VATFEQLRISLDRDAPGPILDATEHTESFRDRREFLRAAFADERTFAKGSKRFEFVPLPIDGDYVAGIFKRARPLAAHDRSLQKYEAENYEGAVFILATSKPQLAWMQFNPRLGSNKALLDSFFSFLRHFSDIRDWKTYVEYLHDEEEYWSVIERRRYEIAKITFTFIPPNALSADEKIWDLIKAVHAEAHPDIQQHSYRAPPGQMKPDTEHMAASARIAMAGGGEADVRSGDGRLLYNCGRSR